MAPRENSVILDGINPETQPATQPKKERKTMATPLKDKLKEVKATLKIAKANAAASKKAVAEAQKGFILEPQDAEEAKTYKAAVGVFIKDTKAVAKAQIAVDKVLTQLEAAA